MKSIYKIIILCFLFPLITNANNADKKHEETKTIKKEYAVNSNARVILNNKYGDLNITTWDKNRVEIEVIITVKGDDLEHVEEKLNSISINFKASKSLVEATTIIGENKSSWSWWGKSKNTYYKINYIVKMPKTNSVDLENDYGSIYLGNLSGKASINSDYGKISVSNLSANNNSINLNYCSSSTILYMKSGTVNIDYSKLTIDKSENIKLNADYATLKFGRAGEIDFNLDYGSITIDDSESINGNSDYATLRLGTVRKKLRIDTDYGSLTIKRLMNGFDKVDISGQYTSIKIGVEKEASFDFEIDLQYADFKRDDAKVELFKNISKTTKKYYEGKYGQKKTNSSLLINSQYGSVRIEEN
jgi:hypothetical protein